MSKKTKRLYEESEGMVIKAITEAAVDADKYANPEAERSIWVRGVSNDNEFDITGVISRVGSEKPTTVCIKAQDRNRLRNNIPSYSRRMRLWSEYDYRVYDGFYVPWFIFDYYELVVDEGEESLEDVLSRIERKAKEAI